MWDIKVEDDINLPDIRQEESSTPQFHNSKGTTVASIEIGQLNSQVVSGILKNFYIHKLRILGKQDSFIQASRTLKKWKSKKKRLKVKNNKSLNQLPEFKNHPSPFNTR